jgi:hypothetical protein
MAASRDALMASRNACAGINSCKFVENIPNHGVTETLRKNKENSVAHIVPMPFGSISVVQKVFDDPLIMQDVY